MSDGKMTFDHTESIPVDQGMVSFAPVCDDRTVRHIGAYRVAKRAFDLGFSLLLLVVTLPFSLLLVLAVKASSPGPVFFSQQRVGKDGKLFTIYKFRTMYANAPKYAVTPTSDMCDPRVTRVGRLLRRSGLDELPQFINVLRGEMSVVGPRPEMAFLVDNYSAAQRRRLCVLPGITGPWQLSSARHKPIHEHLEYDDYYLQNASFSYDLQLVARTAWFTLRILLKRLLRAPFCGNKL